jgi:hypothetical protein
MFELAPSVNLGGEVLTLTRLRGDCSEIGRKKTLRRKKRREKGIWAEVGFRDD